MNHDVENDAGRPHIRFEIVALSGMDFWGHVRWRTDLLALPLLADDWLLFLALVKADAEIGNLDFSEVVNQNVLKLNVAVNDVLGVDVPQAYDDLSEQVLGQILVQLNASAHILQEVPALAGLHEN